MSTFRSSVEHRFSADGTEKTTWAHFTPVSDSDPAVYEFTTTNKEHIAALRTLIAAAPEGYRDISEVRPRRPRKAKTAG